MGVSDGLSCGSITIKYLLFIFNFFFVACGIALVVIGAIPLTTTSVSDYNSVALSFVIAVGIIIFLISFFGCCGAVRESRCMLITFATCLGIIVILQITGVILAFVNAREVKIDKGLKNLFDRAAKNDVDAKTSTDQLQQVFSCCGYNGPQSWHPKPTPPSCCAVKLTGSSCKPFEKSCKSEVESYIKKWILAIGIVGIIVAVIEFIGIWFALALAHSLRRVEDEHRGQFAPVPKNPLQAAEAQDADVHTV